MSSFEDIETLLSMKVILVVVSGGLVGVFGLCLASTLVPY